MSDAAPPPVPSRRLFAAVEAIYAAEREFGGMGALPYPPALVGSVAAPAAFRGFSVREIGEATRFLLRMGLLTASPDEED